MFFCPATGAGRMPPLFSCCVWCQLRDSVMRCCWGFSSTYAPQGTAELQSWDTHTAVHALCGQNHYTESNPIRCKIAIRTDSNCILLEDFPLDVHVDNDTPGRGSLVFSIKIWCDDQKSQELCPTLN